MLAMLLCTIKNEYIAYCSTKKLYKIKWEKFPLVIENKIHRVVIINISVALRYM